MMLFLLSVACFGCLVLPMCGQVSRPLNPSLVANEWPAEWIACPNAPQKDAGVFYFRKELNLATVPVHYWVHVSADNQFLLHVNGKFAGEGPARGDLFHWRFETIDLAPLLHPGNNTLAAIVWNFGAMAPIAQMSSRTGFLLQGDTVAEQAANTGPSWRVEQQLGWGPVTDEKFAGYFGAGSGERIDGRLLNWNWDLPDAAGSSGWQKPELIGHAATRGAMSLDTNWESVPDLLPPMEHRLVAAGKPVRVEGLTSLPAFPAQPLTIPANTHVALLLDNRVLQTAYPVLVVSGGRDAKIQLTYAEALYDAHGQKGNRNQIARRHIQGLTDEFISGGGSQRAFAPLNWRTWRYLQIDVTTKSTSLRLESLKAWFTAYPFQMKANISGDIADLDRIWSTGWRTARLCAHTTYMDTPYWERLQYVGDTRIEALISYVDSGDSRLARQAITNIDDSRVPNGLTQSRYPSWLPQFIPTFSLIWIDMLHDYWMYVDDSVLVRETLPHTRGVIDWYTARLRPDGLMGKVGWWEFGDWTSDYKDGVPPQDTKGGSTFLTLQYMEALRDAAEMETALGNPQRAEEYRTIFKKASAALNRSNWDARYGLFADTPEKKTYSQEANILAVWLDVIAPSQQAAVLRRILGSRPGSVTMVDGKQVPPMSELTYYFRFYLSRALEHAGLGNVYLDELGPWRNMLNLGLSTWAETPEPTRSDSHAWSASPNYDLLTIVAGIQASAPGFTRVRIEPHLGTLTHLEATMPHAGGKIHVAYRRVGASWSATIDLPADLTGKFVWSGHIYPLHAGSQEFHLPVARKAVSGGVGRPVD
jgi:alpha-L-rhamnosidase